MAIKILYFGELKDQLGKSQQDLEYQQNLTVEQIFCQTLEDKPDLKKWQNKILFGRNHEQVDGSTTVQDGDEIAFMPPMAGG